VVLREQGRPDEAVAAFLEAIHLEPHDPDTWCGLGLAYLAKGNRDGALEVHHQLAILDPPTAEEFARVHLPALAAVGEGPGAMRPQPRRSLATGRAVAPTPGDAWYEMGVMYRKRGEDDQAVAAFEEAVRFEPGHVKAWYGLALLHHKHRRLAEAKKAFHRVVRLKPDLAPVWCQVGALYRELGQGEKGIQAYERALALSPESVEAWCGLAQAAALAGRTATVAEAQNHLEALDLRMAERLRLCLQSRPASSQPAVAVL
jgi:tetratricopeptide (TPR) repeat protein